MELSWAAAGICSRDELGRERLVGRVGQDRTAADDEGKQEQQRRRHVASDRERSECRRGDHEGSLDCHQQSTPVERVGQHAADDAEHHIGEHVGGLDECDEDRCVSLVDEEPLGTDGLHPGADVAGERGEPQPAKDGETKGGPRRQSRLRFRHARTMGSWTASDRSGSYSPVPPAHIPLAALPPVHGEVPDGSGGSPVSTTNSGTSLPAPNRRCASVRGSSRATPDHRGTPQGAKHPLCPHQLVEHGIDID